MRREVLEPRLAERLQKQYFMERLPADLGELVEHVKKKTISTPGGREMIASIREGKMTLGQTDQDRGQSIVSPSGEEVKVMCGYDALGSALLRGEGLVKATCFHCGEQMEIQIRERKVVETSNPSILFWLGDGPKGIPICDHYNLFPDRKHLDSWLETNKEELGIALSLEDAVGFLKESSDGL
ncbi:MAG: organomercurial lyase, partial [Nitrososphaerales archaeon]